MTIPTLSTSNTFGELINDTQQLIQQMNLLTDGPQFNANTTIVLSKVIVANLTLNANSTVVGLNTNSVRETTTNLYFTAARVRANVSNTAPINYDSTTGIISHANSGATAAVYGNSTYHPVVTVDAKGHVTGVSNTATLQPVYRSHSLISTRAGINFIPGANITISVVDDSSNNLANITFDGVWGGGPNPLGFIRLQTANATVTTTITNNTNTINFLSGPGVNVTGAFDSGNTATKFFVYANGAYDTANGAFAAANLAQNTVNANTTSANIRAKVSNTAPVTYDTTNGIIGFATSGVSATTYGNTSFVPTITVDTFGRITAASNVAISYLGARSVLSAGTFLSYDSGNGIISHASSGAVAGTYGSGGANGVAITVDATGHITSVSNVAISLSGARSAFSNTAPINYDSTNGIFSHATSGVTATTYGDTISIPVFAVNATGHVTSVTNTTIRTTSTSQTGVVQLNDTVSSNSTTQGATANAVFRVNTSVTNLAASLGTMSTQSASAVSITGGMIIGANLYNVSRVTESINTILTGTLNQTYTLNLSYGSTFIQSSNGTNPIAITNQDQSGGVLHSHFIIIGGGFNNLTWPGAVQWGLGGKPSIPTGVVMLSLIVTGGGTSYYASIYYRES
jgi:hypothetical protein